MDLNTNLRDDKFLFPNGDDNASTIIVNALNERGIKTVNDFINYDSNKFNTRNKHYLKALIQIFKYRYLGEEIINDVVFDLEYPTNKTGIRKLAKDLRRLGFGFNLNQLIVVVENYALDKQVEELTVEQILKASLNGEIFRVFKNRNVHDLPELQRQSYQLKITWMGNADLRKFYLNYIEKKRLKDLQEHENPSKETLEGLKSQLQNLVMMRDNLDKLIQDTQCQINELNGGQQTHGRK